MNSLSELRKGTIIQLNYPDHEEDGEYFQVISRRGEKVNFKQLSNGEIRCQYLNKTNKDHWKYITVLGNKIAKVLYE